MTRLPPSLRSDCRSTVWTHVQLYATACLAFSILFLIICWSGLLALGVL